MAPSVLARIAVTLGVALGAGTLATEASAASLSLTVSPAVVHPGGRYTVSIFGRYDKRAHPRAHLVAFVQFSGRSCQSTATAEYALRSSEWTWAVYPTAEKKSPFKSVTYWKAGSRRGARRVCAYLYPGSVGPGTTAEPLAEAGLSGAAFRVTRG
jgi:hypothetical protein